MKTRVFYDIIGLMKKSYLFVCIILVILLLLGSVVACTDDTRKLYFTETTYKLYLSDENPSVTPEVFTRPRGNEYILSVSNPTIAKVDGNTITALKEGIVTITASSGDMTATATLVVYLRRDATNDDDNTNDGKHSVYFISEYSAFAAQRITDGETATQPTPPPRDGYILFGWYLDEGFTTPYDFATPVHSNINLYALWGYASPAFKFTKIDEKTYVSGFKYSYVPYEQVTLPATDDEGNAVYGVANSAFSGDKHLVSVIIPDCYKVIGTNAFENLEKLETVTFNGSGIEELGELAFNECSSLQKVDFGGEGLLSIGPSCFGGCEKLAEINLPNSVSKLGRGAFNGCSALNISTLPSSLKVIEAQTFAYTGIKSIDLSGIEAIYNQAFWGATSLSEIKNPDSILSLGSYVFGSLLNTEEKDATPWLKNTQEVSKFEGKNGSKVTYLGNALVYVSPVGIGTKPLPTYIKQSTTTIAGQAFSDVNDACAFFIGLTPPTYGTCAFGGGNAGSLKPTVDIVVPEGKTELYSKAFLITAKDTEGYYSPTVYSLELIQRIYESTVAPTVETGMIMYERYPLIEHEKGVFYSKMLAKDADDPFAGVQYSTTEKYFVLHSYFGSATEINFKTLFDNDCALGGYSPVIEKICSYAFNSNDTLKTIKLPINIKYVDYLAFSSCQALEALYLLGDSSHTPYSYQIEQDGINTSFMSANFKIYVPVPLVNSYISTWGAKCTSIRNKFVGMV